MCFDDLERFVGECGTVDGDLSTHPPRGVPQRILNGRVSEALSAPIAKRSTRCSEDDPFHLRARMTGNALENRAVLAVDGNDLARSGSACLSHQVPRDNESFLVRKSDTLSRFERSQRCVEAGGADDGVENNVDVIASRGGDERI